MRNKKERIIQAIKKIINKHNETLATYSNFASQINDKSLKDYCESAIAMRKTLIEDLESETNALGTAEIPPEPEVKTSNIWKYINPKKSKQKVIDTIKSLESTMIKTYMRIIRTNTFPSITESILNAHVDTLKHRFAAIGNYSPALRKVA